MVTSEEGPLNTQVCEIYATEYLTGILVHISSTQDNHKQNRIFHFVFQKFDCHVCFLIESMYVSLDV